MRYKIRHKVTGKEFGYLYNRQDAENAILHLEDTKGYDYRDLEIIEESEETDGTNC